MNLGRAIRVVRVAKNIQQQTVAKRAGFDNSYLSLLESGHRRPSFDGLVRISAALDVPPYLLILLASDHAELAGLPETEAQRIGAEVLKVLTEG
jgi:transcriptional regulator with XRE-family HTH domain